ncbi:TPA: hypothetical protein ACTZ5S_005571 [Bacillus cereus]|uniref:hypothetical protein n=1 Tax=Bacillus cereus group TaxID=86661 RepID=UPI001596C41F|nr:MULTISPECIES: hypothetical protein [Bacillus cereus group]MDZ4551162.1 hypothetical protein [Bacillus cereus]MEC2708082.1 hypothetical protein [Bacillus thuringiensis]MED3586517.1 hypothetical protein [Bacillus thuringiensis]
MPIFVMSLIILAGVFLILVGLNANRWGYYIGQPTMGCGIVLILFVVVLIIIWP